MLPSLDVAACLLRLCAVLCLLVVVTLTVFMAMLTSLMLYVAKLTSK